MEIKDLLEVMQAKNFVEEDELYEFSEAVKIRVVDLISDIELKEEIIHMADEILDLKDTGIYASAFALSDAHANWADLLKKAKLLPSWETYQSLGCQDWFLDKMAALGYKINKDGMCFGMSAMALQAFISDDIETFHQRSQWIYSAPLEYFLNDFEKLKKIKDNLNKSAQSFEQIGELDKALNEREKADEINQNMIDALAFFDGISINQSPRDFKELFDRQKNPSFQDYQTSMNLTISNVLQKINDNGEQIQRPVIVDTLVSEYSLEKLRYFLEKLEESFSHNISLLLHCNQHAINLNLSVCPKTNKKKWILIDPNNMPEITFSNVQRLAGTVFKYYLIDKNKNDNVLTMATEIYSKKKNKELSVRSLTALNKNDEFYKMHDGSRVNVFSNKCEAAKYAVFYNKVDFMKKAFEFLHDIDKVNLLSISCMRNHVELSKFLIDKGVKPNKEIYQNVCQLMQVEIAELLYDEVGTVSVAETRDFIDGLPISSNQREEFLNTLKARLIAREIFPSTAEKRFIDSIAKDKSEKYNALTRKRVGKPIEELTRISFESLKKLMTVKNFQESTIKLKVNGKEIELTSKPSLNEKDVIIAELDAGDWYDKGLSTSSMAMQSLEMPECMRAALVSVLKNMEKRKGEGLPESAIREYVEISNVKNFINLIKAFIPQSLVDKNDENLANYRLFCYELNAINPNDTKAFNTPTPFHDMELKRGVEKVYNEQYIPPLSIQQKKILDDILNSKLKEGAGEPQQRKINKSLDNETNHDRYFSDKF